MYYLNGVPVEEDFYINPTVKCSRGDHEWCDTGLLATYCKHCGKDGEWCRRTNKYVNKGSGHSTVSDDDNS